MVGRSIVIASQPANNNRQSERSLRRDDRSVPLAICCVSIAILEGQPTISSLSTFLFFPTFYPTLYRICLLELIRLWVVRKVDTLCEPPMSIMCMYLYGIGLCYMCDMWRSIEVSRFCIICHYPLEPNGIIPSSTHHFVVLKTSFHSSLKKLLINSILHLFFVYRQVHVVVVGF